jgi:hypothetical protein
VRGSPLRNLNKILDFGIVILVIIKISWLPLIFFGGVFACPFSLSNGGLWEISPNGASATDKNPDAHVQSAATIFLAQTRAENNSALLA